MSEGGDQKPLKILVVRPDRLGDVILSTPVIEVLKTHYPKSHLTMMVREPHFPLIQGLKGVDEVMAFDPDGRHAGIGGLFKLIREFREREIRIGVVLQSHWKIAAALFSAGIRYRVGPLSKPHSFLFYNRGIRQSRSLVEMHETDYNLQLLRRLGVRVGTRSVPTRVQVPAEAMKWALEWLAERGWKAGTPGRGGLILVHPGMGGSALNWPDHHYLELVRALVRDGHHVIVTAGPTEGELIGRIQSEMGPLRDKILFYGGTGAGSIDRLGALMRHSSVVVAPSTGPLHLAVALGRPVVTFYPPIRVQSAIRWGPYVADDSRASVMVPETYCGQDFECLGNLCNYFPCMKSLQVSEALGQVQKHLAREGEPDHGQR